MYIYIYYTYRYTQISICVYVYICRLLMFMCSLGRMSPRLGSPYKCTQLVYNLAPRLAKQQYRGRWGLSLHDDNTRPPYSGSDYNTGPCMNVPLFGNSDLSQVPYPSQPDSQRFDIRTQSQDLKTNRAACKAIILCFVVDPWLSLSPLWRLQGAFAGALKNGIWMFLFLFM